jgi:hypothetical protein
LIVFKKKNGERTLRFSCLAEGRAAVFPAQAPKKHPAEHYLQNPVKQSWPNM